MGQLMEIMAHLLVTMSSQTEIGSSLGWGYRDCHFESRQSTADVDSKLAVKHNTKHHNTHNV